MPKLTESQAYELPGPLGFVGSEATWEYIPKPRIHICRLPDPKDFHKGDRIRCTASRPSPEPPISHRGKNYSRPPGIPCHKRYRLGLTWFWRDKVWRQE